MKQSVGVDCYTRGKQEKCWRRYDLSNRFNMKMSVLEKEERFVVLLLLLNFLMDSILISSTKCLVLRTNHFGILWYSISWWIPSWFLIFGIDSDNIFILRIEVLIYHYRIVVVLFVRLKALLLTMSMKWQNTKKGSGMHPVL